MSHKILRWTLLALFLIALLVSVPMVRGDDDGDDEDTADDKPSAAGDDPTAAGGADADGDDDDDADADDASDDTLRASDDVVISFIFPDHADKRLPAGEKITLLVGFQNKGSTTFNVTRVHAALHSPFQYDYYIQNFTYREVSSLVGPKEEASVEYTFTPDKSIEPLEFHLSASIFYNDTINGGNYRSTVLNGTVELVEKPSEFTAKTLFTYVLAVAGLGLAGYIGLNVSGGLNKPVERGTRGGGGSSSTTAEAVAASWATPEFKPKAKADKFGVGKNKKPNARAASPRAAPADAGTESD